MDRIHVDIYGGGAGRVAWSLHVDYHNTFMSLWACIMGRECCEVV